MKDPGGVDWGVVDFGGKAAAALANGFSLVLEAGVGANLMGFLAASKVVVGKALPPNNGADGACMGWLTGEVLPPKGFGIELPDDG